ncbi:MAG: sodium:proton antiporter [Bacteroidetes bacterium]|nr:sodium:proton antiporter [Bacteroidota bacterium]
MTYFLIIALCVIVLISYIFELTGKFTKIPGVILLVVTGMAANYLLEYLNIKIPDFSSLLPIMGTLGLILIVLEGSLDLTISRKKGLLIGSSITSAIMLFVIFEIIFTYILVNFYGIPSRTALINTIPLGIISSAVAIPSAARLSRNDKEFVTYESSFSDIVGILAFDFILFNYSSLGNGILGFVSDLLLTIIGSIVFSIILAYILHKINHHVKHVIITAMVILVYALAKMVHMPSLLVVLVFGLIMNNSSFLKNKYSLKIIDFDEFKKELQLFKNITYELTFVIRSFFFITFGYYTSVADLLDIGNLLIALVVSATIFIIRALYFIIVLKKILKPSVFTLLQED